MTHGAQRPSAIDGSITLHATYMQMVVLLVHRIQDQSLPHTVRLHCIGCDHAAAVPSCCVCTPHTQTRLAIACEQRGCPPRNDRCECNKVWQLLAAKEHVHESLMHMGHLVGESCTEHCASSPSRRSHEEAGPHSLPCTKGQGANHSSLPTQLHTTRVQLHELH